jgi:hypothetical protein
MESTLDATPGNDGSETRTVSYDMHSAHRDDKPLSTMRWSRDETNKKESTPHHQHTLAKGESEGPGHSQGGGE